ncbi:RRNA processing protein Utp6 [Penicillium verhagenii]|uniref:RRNA processing protein Utp6 n=1 Tax=Penicillium verhagenii TaxID=1562060 RepID=UPI00254510E7|nr:RRNA processing protein Utp6 [Penicillium verhagenii]KAJ5924581.1 RRNA processing protein Utp6 [Penicillium verhagenii]
MSAATDKARYFLEKSVPELKEFEKKKLFTKDEITSIIKKRSDFEHKLNARGAKPVDFVRYVEYEINLDTLCKKRTKRMGIRSAGHSGQRRILFVLDRATRRFHGDLNLWIQYIEYTRKQKAYKKLAIILTDALRFHPTSAELWIYAAKYSLDEHADMSQARSYMQRGLRFCKSARLLWIQYAKLELIYIAKLVARQRILGLDEASASKRSKAVESAEVDHDADMIAMPAITEEDINPAAQGDESDEAAKQALETLNATPALSGAIPLAIFDSAMKHFKNDDQIASEFYKMVSEFDDVPCLSKILGHVVENMQAHKPTSALTLICYIKFPTTGVRVTSPEFPRALGSSLARLKESQPLNATLAQEVVNWLKPLSETEDLDPSLKMVIVSTMRNAERALSA